jgi:Kdo2-lipid IVA lauroyltransferase/acyltransferase
LPAWVTRFREWIEFSVFRFVAAIFAALPLEGSAEFSAWSWGLIAPLLPRHQRALEHLAFAFPEKSQAERERIARRMWKNLGRTFAEFFHLKQILAEKRVELVPFPTFEHVAGTAPFVVCIPHLGNWEIASQAGLRFDVPLAGTYQALTNPLVDKWLLDQRKVMYTGGLYPKSASSARAMLKLPRQGVCPSFVADLRESGGVPAEFFGRTAMSNPFPAIVARTLGLPVYAACVIRTQRARFEMHITQVETPRSNDRDADVLAITQGVQSAFETFVREWPDQWMWAHKRWG